MLTHLDLDDSARRMQHTAEVSGIADAIIRMSFFFDMGASIDDVIRSILREPLKCPRFRRLFNEHFERHEDHDLATIGAQWLDKVLVFEDE